jgi:transcriptional regulator with XRE-family HTH domain
MTERPDDEHSEYTRALGTRLRAVRTQLNLSLQAVERSSHGRWKAVVVGSYERGDRAISVQRLADLAAFYGVPVSALLPREEGSAVGVPEVQPLSKIVINLTKLRALGGDAALLQRVVSAIQRQRGDHGRATLSIRQADLSTLATVYETTPSGMTDQLVRWQILAPQSLILDGEP